MPTVLHYDRGDAGCKRPRKNFEAIIDAVGPYAHVEHVERPKDFGSEMGAETRLLREPFPYDAVVVNAMGSNSQVVVDAAMIGMEMSGMSPSKLIYLHCSSKPCDMEANGVTCVPARGGNGHLLPQDAATVAEMIRKLCE